MTNMIYALVGPHSSGKTTLAVQLISMGIHFIPTYTTRSFTNRGNSRQQSEKMQLYRTVSWEEFKQLDLIVQYTYKGDYFGICKDDILNAVRDHKISLTILELNGVKQLNKLIKKKLSTVYLMADYVTLVDRMLRAGCNNEEIKYHLQYAENNKEFDNWKIANHVIKNTGTPQDALIQLLSILGLVTPLPSETFKEMIK